MVDVPINDWNNQTKGTVTLEIADGEFVLLQGPNGSGKSYLLNLMAALRVPSVGEVFLEGKRLTRCASGKKGLARRIRPHTIRAGALERLHRFGRPGFDGPAPGQERCRRETQRAGKRVSLRFRSLFERQG